MEFRFMHPEVNELIRAPYFDTYLKLLDSASIEEGLNHSSKELRDLLETIPDDQLDYSYAPGKWTVKQVIQHVIETEQFELAGKTLLKISMDSRRIILLPMRKLLI